MKKNLLKSTLVFSGMTMISRVTGLLRDMVFASYFGAAAGMDAFNIAYRIPNFFRCLFGEGAFSQGFIPVLAEYKQNKDQAEVVAFLQAMAGVMLLVLFVFTAVAILVTPWLIYAFAPGYIHDVGRIALTTTMLRITFPYILFISLSAYASGILNAYGKFGIPAFAPNLLNLSLIGAAMFLAKFFAQPIVALAWGVFIGGLAQLLFQLPFLLKLNLLAWPKITWRNSGVMRVLKLMIPALFGVSVAQISFLVDNFLASYLSVGSISWLYYANRLTMFPLGVFGVAIATVVLPNLSGKYAAKSAVEFSQILDWALKFVLIIALPATIGIMMLSGPIIATLFQFKHGQFNDFDVVMVQQALLGFAVGIPAFMLVKVLASGFYSRQNIKAPVKIAVIAVIANIILASILFVPLKHAGLALATSLTSVLNASLLFYLMRKDDSYQPGNGWAVFWLRLLFASIALIAFLWIFQAKLIIWLNWGFFTRAWHLAVLCVGAVTVYVVSLLAGGMRPRDFKINIT